VIEREIAGNMSDPVLYFAYGSNLHPLRLSLRVPSAQAVGVGTLEGRRLAFHKTSRLDASGKCDVPPAAPGQRVFGALYAIAVEQWPVLVAIEGVGKGYDEVRLRVESAAGVVTPVLFVADAKTIDPALAPYDWYKALVVEGAKYHRFPAEYVEAIEAVPAIEDSNEERAQRHWRLIAAMRRTGG